MQTSCIQKKMRKKIFHGRSIRIFVVLTVCPAVSLFAKFSRVASGHHVYFRLIIRLSTWAPPPFDVQNWVKRIALNHGIKEFRTVTDQLAAFCISFNK